MEDLFNKLINNENFGLWLMIVIIGLVLIFLVILLLGKKDKKEREIEETKKILQINDENAFKEENTNVALETPQIPSEQVIADNKVELNSEPLTNDNEVIAPVITNDSETTSLDDLLKINNEESTAPLMNNTNKESVYKLENPVNDEKVEKAPVPEINSLNSLINNDSKKEEPILNDTVTPLLSDNVEELNVFNNDNFSSLPEVEIPNIEDDLKEEASNIPDFNLDNIIDDITSELSKPTTDEVKPKEVNVPTKDELEFELPKLKEEYQVKEMPKSDNEALVKEDKIEVPKLNDYNLDSISGEFYNINDK